MKPRFIVPTLLVLALLTGCSTPQDRARERADTFNSLPATVRDSALKGELREGMTPDAVYVALGNPARVVTGVNKGVQLERWVYTRIESREIPAWRDVPYRTGVGTIALVPTYEPITVSRARDSFEVKFEGGKVVGWGGL